MLAVVPPRFSWPPFAQGAPSTTRIEIPVVLRARSSLRVVDERQSRSRGRLRHASAAGPGKSSREISGPNQRKVNKTGDMELRERGVFTGGPIAGATVAS